LPWFKKKILLHIWQKSGTIYLNSCNQIVALAAVDGQVLVIHDMLNEQRI
jgi:hypothetical protein